MELEGLLFWSAQVDVAPTFQQQEAVLVSIEPI